MRTHYLTCIDKNCERAACVDRRLYDAKITRLESEVARLREALEFYADTEKMYDTAHESDGVTIGYVRGLDDDCDMEKIAGTRELHHGKRARQALKETE